MKAFPFNLLAFAASLTAISAGVYVALIIFPTRMWTSDPLTAIEWGFVGAALTFWVPAVLTSKRRVSVLITFAAMNGLINGTLAYLWTDLWASV